MKDRVLLEVAVGSVDGALAAHRAGADRIELNSALELAGLTPSAGLIAAMKQALPIPIIAMIRPRSGDFVYSDLEFDVMRRDIDSAIALGVDGVAFGILTRDGRIDVERCRVLLRQIAGGPIGRIQSVFHRAFDLTADPIGSLQELMELGFTRLLTSGQAADAIAGATLIGQLRKAGAGRIEILPGAGIRAENVAEVIRLTGCKQVHGSFSKVDEHSMGPLGKVRRMVTDSVAVRRARGALDAG